MTSSIQHPDDKGFLPALALAMVTQPRANLQELARAIGVSKATLYRYCRTREQLVQRLTEHSIQTLWAGIRGIDLENDPPLDVLRHMIAHSLENREMHAFLIYYWKEATVEPGIESDWEATMDAFFLRGQREGVFRIDVSAPALTEIWAAILVGLIDAERRGRIARVGMGALIENAFLHGAHAH